VAAVYTPWFHIGLYETRAGWVALEGTRR
jgi:hypothetical protein